MLTAKHQASFTDTGYVVVAGLFRPAEIAQYRDHFMTLRRRGSFPGDLVGSDPRANDPLRKYPGIRLSSITYLMMNSYQNYGDWTARRWRPWSIQS